MERFVNICVVCAGSALGGGLRYLVSLFTAERGWTSFAWPTLIVNVVGCFLIMLIVTIGGVVTMRTNVRLFLTTGIMGGLTTYSTFDFDTTKYFQDGAPAMAFLNIAVTLVACFVAGLLGIVLAHWLIGE